MKKLVMISVLATILMASCSKDSIVEESITRTSSTEYNVTYATMKEALQHIPNIENITEKNKEGYSENFELSFRQSADHNNASAGTFLQRVVIHFVGFDAPTVLSTCGYTFDQNYELAESMKANIVAVEHRYFGESVINNDPQWNYLTLKQAADDLHEIVTALRPVLKGKWISTGVSKSGTTSIQYRYIYPNDVDGTVAFCAPILTSNADPAPMSYMLNESATPEFRQEMKSVIAKLLAGGEKGYYQKYLDYMKDDGFEESELPTFSQFAFGVFNLFFHHLSYSTADMWTKYLPTTDTSDKKLFELLDDVMPQDPEEDVFGPTYMYPYFIQQVKEFGRETIFTEEGKAWLEGTSCTPESVILMNLKKKDISVADDYDNSVSMTILNELLPKTDSKIMFVYSKNDPWTGGRPKNLNNPNVQILINPVGVHAECLDKVKSHETYDEATAQAIMKFVQNL